MNGQLSMDFTARTLARNSDPITSHRAAERVIDFSRSHNERIVTILREHGPATAHEIAEHCDIPAHAILKRLPECERAGYVSVVTDGEGEEMTRASPSGRAARVWFAVGGA